MQSLNTHLKELRELKAIFADSESVMATLELAHQTMLNYYAGQNQWGMRLLSPEEAVELNLNNKEIFRLYDDGTEAVVEDIFDIVKGEIYGTNP